jgi:hypothetical protein
LLMGTKYHELWPLNSVAFYSMSSRLPECSIPQHAGVQLSREANATAFFADLRIEQ